MWRLISINPSFIFSPHSLNPLCDAFRSLRTGILISRSITISLVNRRDSWKPVSSPAPKRVHSLLHASGRISDLLLQHTATTHMQPASETKHIPQLPYEFQGRTFLLNQQDDHGVTNGTTLWLGGQILSYYLAFVERKGAGSGRKTAIELGSGIGLTALALHSLGWNVCATDLEPVLSTVLKPNLTSNSQNNNSRISNTNIPDPSVPHILECRELDWTVPTASWKWDQLDSIARHSAGTSTGEDQAEHELPVPLKTTLQSPYDLIITADTLYAAALITPLLRSLHHLSALSIHPGSKFSCPIYIAVERRDPQLMDRAFEECSSVWGFKVERIRAAKIKKALERANVSWVAEKSLWEGVEIWKLRLPVGAAPDAVFLTNPGG